MVKQYVGARYVPKFADPVAWASGTSYEAMTIVTYNNSSYTSKIPVPPTVGNPANNPDYWALTGNYNAQVEEYRQTVLSLETKLGEITTVFDNVADMVASSSLSIGDYVLTRGYHTPYDGGATVYKISNDSTTPDYKISVKNGYAVPQFDKAITPEQFGAYGDDSHDDTNSLQDAVNYLVNKDTSVKKLISQPYKIYKITSPVSINETEQDGLSHNFTIDFGNATIKTYANISAALIISSTYSSSTGVKANWNVLISNVKIDCNDTTSVGINKSGSTGITFEGITIENIASTGIIQQDASNFYNIQMTGSKTSATSVGFKIHAGDSIYDNIVLNRLNVALDLNGASASIFSNVHGWAGKVNYKNSAFIIDRSGNWAIAELGSWQMINAYCDTYQYCVRRHSRANCSITNLHVIYNKYDYTDTSYTPYIIYCGYDDGSQQVLTTDYDKFAAFFKMAIINATIFKHPDIDTYYTNINSEDKLTKYPIGRYSALKDASEINNAKLTINSKWNLSSMYEAPNSIKYSDGIISVTFSLSPSQSYSSGNYNPCDLPGYYYWPDEMTVPFVGYALNPAINDLFMLNGWINPDGKIYITIPSGKTINSSYQINANITYSSEKDVATK